MSLTIVTNESCFTTGANSAVDRHLGTRDRYDPSIQYDYPGKAIVEHILRRFIHSRNCMTMRPTSLIPPVAVSVAVLLLCIASSSAMGQVKGRSTLDRKIVQSDSSSGRYLDARGTPVGRADTRGVTTRLLDASGRSVGRIETRSGTSRLYAPNGAMKGRAESREGQTRYFDASGRSQGRSQTSGATTRFYSASGTYEGRSETRGGTTRYFDRSGRSLGSKR